MKGADISIIIQAVSAIIQVLPKLIDKDPNITPEQREALRHDTMRLVERAQKIIKP